MLACCVCVGCPVEVVLILKVWVTRLKWVFFFSPNVCVGVMNPLSPPPSSPSFPVVVVFEGSSELTFFAHWLDRHRDEAAEIVDSNQIVTMLPILVGRMVEYYQALNFQAAKRNGTTASSSAGPFFLRAYARVCVGVCSDHGCFWMRAPRITLPLGDPPPPLLSCNAGDA